MAGYRTYRKRFYKRGAKYYKRTAKLTRYNTYRHRSSAAQASQIYSLARRINRIQRLNKPEIKLMHYYTSDTLNFNNGVFSTTYPLLLSSQIQGGQPVTVPFNELIDGKFARINSMAITMSYRYEDASLVQVDADEYTQRLPQPIYLRMVFYQLKSSRQTAVSDEDIVDIFNNFTRVRGPLADGAARVVKILSDRKYLINYNHQTVNRVIRFNYLRNYYKPASEPIAKGDIRVLIQAWNPDTGVDDSTTNVVLNLNVKTAYTDA